MAKQPLSNQGQDKTHTITSSTTGETRVVTQDEWRRDGAALKAQGFSRPEGLEDEDVAEEGTDTETDTDSDDGTQE